MPRTSSTRLRSNLLHKLGIPPSGSDLASSSPAVIPSIHAPSRGSLLGNVKATRVPLKEIEDDHDTRRIVPEKPMKGHAPADVVFQALGSLWTQQPLVEESEADSADSTSQNSTTPYGSLSTTTSCLEGEDSNKAERHVHFDSNVTVLPIPRREQYSNRIRGFLWGSREELQQTIVRNTLEYTADGWDWHAALLEEEHYYNPSTHEFIHPVHLEIAQMPLIDQEAILPPNYSNPALQQQLQQQLQQEPVESTVVLRGR